MLAMDAAAAVGANLTLFRPGISRNTAVAGLAVTGLWLPRVVEAAGLPLLVQLHFGAVVA